MVLRHVTRTYGGVHHRHCRELYPIAELGVYRGYVFAPPSIASALVQSPHQNFNLSHGIPGILLGIAGFTKATCLFLLPIADLNCCSIYLIIYCTESIDADPPASVGVLYACTPRQCRYPIRVTANHLGRPFHLFPTFLLWVANPVSSPLTAPTKLEYD